MAWVLFCICYCGSLRQRKNNKWQQIYPKCLVHIYTGLNTEDTGLMKGFTHWKRCARLNDSFCGWTKKSSSCVCVCVHSFCFYMSLCSANIKSLVPIIRHQIFTEHAVHVRDFARHILVPAWNNHSPSACDEPIGFSINWLWQCSTLLTKLYTVLWGQQHTFICVPVGPNPSAKLWFFFSTKGRSVKSAFILEMN